jgi:hypothetical protein
MLSGNVKYLSDSGLPVVGQFGFGGRALLPAAGFQPALAA